MPVFLNENRVLGLSATSPYQVGVSDPDNGQVPELQLGLPYYIDPDLSYEIYQCWPEYELDSGIVTHQTLPQSHQPADTLGGGFVDDPGFSKIAGGVNLKSAGNFSYFTQRMASSCYRVCLRGYCRRVGLVPVVPVLRYVGTPGNYVPAIPDDREPQRVVGPLVVGNNSGIPVYMMAWKSWYTVAVPPKVAPPAPTNLSEAMGQVPPPAQAAAPVSGPDQFAQRAAPPQLNPFGNVPVRAPQ
jgi:hypothetical protein